MFHYLDHVRRFWTGLVRHDEHDMQKVDYVTVKALELKAPGTSTSDSMTLYRQLRKGEIFSAFDLDRRMKIWAKLQTWEGLIPTLWTFFEDFKYIKACANCVKSLVRVPSRGTLYTAMARSFSETNQKRGKCIIQEAESAFTFRSSNTQKRVALHYRQVFLYVMRHLRELSPGSTKLEPKPSERKIRTTKDPNKSVLYGLADLAERLGYKSEKISDLKAKYSSHADGRSPSVQLKPVYVVDGPGECQERRCACPFDLAYEESKEFLFFDNMHNTDKSQGSSIQPVFVRMSVYLAYFGRRVSCSEPEWNDQERENDHQEQGRDLTREDVDQIHAPQEQPNAEETREDRDASHLFESPPRSQSVQGNQAPTSASPSPVTFATDSWGALRDICQHPPADCIVFLTPIQAKDGRFQVQHLAIRPGPEANRHLVNELGLRDNRSEYQYMDYRPRMGCKYVEGSCIVKNPYQFGKIIIRISTPDADCMKAFDNEMGKRM